MSSPNDRFLTTRWTRVVAARGETPEARQALSDLCAINYAPVLRFLRAAGHGEDEAREWAHEFFADVLAHRSLEGGDPARGRFRSYLLGALKHFVANRRVRGERQKRRPEGEVIALESETGTGHGAVPEALRTGAPDAVFDREWAEGILERALEIIERESAASSGRETFLALKPWLSAKSEPGAQGEVAAELGMSEGAVKMAIHRLRKRFRQVVREEVAQTISEPGELEAEMRHLIAALAQ